MKTFNPYINFSGQCQQALDFYQTVLGGKIIMRQTFGQAPNAVPGVDPTRIMHAEFQSDGIYFMATDGMQSSSQNNPGQITLNIGFDNLAEQASVFSALSEKGTVTMPLEKTFWGAMFGSLTDQFGINWMLNHQINDKN